MTKCQLTGTDCKHPSCQPVSIPVEVALELQADLSNFLDFYSYNPNGCDYSCIFCRNVAETNGHSVVHKDNCLGEKLRIILDNQLR